MTQSQFIIERTKDWGGNYIDSFYLGDAYKINPHVLQSTMMRMFATKTDYFSEKTLLSMLASTTTQIDTEVFRWHLQSASYRCARVVENVESTNAAPGLGFTTFKVKLDYDGYQKPDTLLPESSEYPLVIVDGPLQEGTGYIYTLKLQTDNPNDFLPPSFLEIGKEFSKFSTAVASEANEDYGTTQFHGTNMLESRIGFFANKLTVTDKAWREGGRLVVKPLARQGMVDKKVESFIPYAEAEMMNTHYRDIEAHLIYGKKSNLQQTSTGYPIATGPGLREQLSHSWRLFSSGALSLPMMQEFFMDIFFARASATNKEVDLMTGTLGEILFHDALAATASSWLTLDTNFVKTTQNQEVAGNTPALQFGGQFVRYVGPGGIAINLRHQKLYDDRTYCKQDHPLFPGKPIDSARFTVLDLSKEGGESNISLLEVKNSFTYGVRRGMWTPNGPNNGDTSHLKHSYDVAVQSSKGVLVKDASRCAEIIPEAE